MSAYVRFELVTSNNACDRCLQMLDYGTLRVIMRDIDVLQILDYGSLMVILRDIDVCGC